MQERPESSNLRLRVQIYTIRKKKPSELMLRIAHPWHESPDIQIRGYRSQSLLPNSASPTADPDLHDQHEIKASLNLHNLKTRSDLL